MTKKITLMWQKNMGMLLICSALAASESAMGQYQVSQPGEPARNAPGNLQNNPDSIYREAGYELYGNNNRDKTGYGSNTWYLPSEFAFGALRTGAAQSEIRMQTDHIGRLSVSNSDYIPPVSPLQRALGVAPPVIFGSAYEKESNVSARSFNNGMINHQNDSGVANRGFLPAGNTVVDPKNLNRSENQRSVSARAMTPQPISQQAIQPIAIPSGQLIRPMTAVNETVNKPVRRTRPTTLPTTSPTILPPEDPTKKLIVIPESK